MLLRIHNVIIKPFLVNGPFMVIYPLSNLNPGSAHYSLFPNLFWSWERSFLRHIKPSHNVCRREQSSTMILTKQSKSVEVKLYQSHFLTSTTLLAHVLFEVNFLSANPTKWSNKNKQFVGNSRRIDWVDLTILWGWPLKG